MKAPRAERGRPGAGQQPGSVGWASAESLHANLARLAADPSRPVATMGWCTLGSALAAETVGRSGVDIVCIDLEHGLWGWDAALPSVLTLSAAGLPVLVRVASHEPIGMMKALDAGADGVIVPHIETQGDAAAAVAACRYPPLGGRSWGPTRTSLLSEDDTNQVNARLVCLAMLESVEAISNVTEIATTAGLGGILVGSNDLTLDMSSATLSRSSARASQDFRDLLAAVAQACRDAGIVWAAPAGTSAEAELLRELGVDVLVLPSDVALLRGAVRKEVADVHGWESEALSFVSPFGRSLRY